MIETALPIADALTVGAYFTANVSEEIALRRLVEELSRRADWRGQNGSDTIRLGWKPDCGFSTSG